MMHSSRIFHPHVLLVRLNFISKIYKSDTDLRCTFCLFWKSLKCVKKKREKDKGHIYYGSRQTFVLYFTLRQPIHKLLTLRELFSTNKNSMHTYPKLINRLQQR